MGDKIIIGIADDREEVHDAMQRLINHYDPDIEIMHFYSAEGTEKYLYKNPGTLSLLFLDIDFGLGMTGTDVVPYLREDDPDLPIVFLTGLDNDVDYITTLMDKYDVEYLSKPLNTLELRSKIKNVRRIKNIIQEYKDLLVLSEEEKQELQIKAEEMRDAIEEVLSHERLLENNEPKIDALNMLKNVFNNLDFTKYAIEAIFDTRFDGRLVKILKPLNDHTPLPAGAKKKKWINLGGKNELKTKINHCYEYRYSKVGRIYTIENDNQLIIIYTIDYNHGIH